MWDLPRSGIKLMSLAFAGGFFTNCITWETSFKFISGCAGSSRLHGLSCSCGKQGLVSSWGAGGLPLRWLLLFRSTGSRARVSSVDVTPGLQSTSSVGVPHGLSCSTACGISPDQGSNSCLWHSQVDSLPLSHQGSLSPGNLF